MKPLREAPKTVFSQVFGAGAKTHFQNPKVPPGWGVELPWARVCAKRNSTVDRVVVPMQTRPSLDDVRDAMRELRAAVLARQQAEAEVRALYCEREIARAKATERGNRFGHPAQEALQRRISSAACNSRWDASCMVPCLQW